MKTREEIKKLLLDNCVDKDGDLNLSRLDFSDFNGDLIFSSIISKNIIYNINQKSKYIDNSKQKAEKINNAEQTIVKLKQTVTLEVTDEELEEIKKFLK